mmetsp:Transcript_44146/g.95770  ORF Transcript_44146/g.95770 Transcript_44146/m.95770 type:complete len:271 (+) Transcript_44146:512-1324(+)
MTSVKDLCFELHVDGVEPAFQRIHEVSCLDELCRLQKLNHRVFFEKRRGAEIFGDLAAVSKHAGRFNEARHSLQDFHQLHRRVEALCVSVVRLGGRREPQLAVARDVVPFDLVPAPWARADPTPFVAAEGTGDVVARSLGADFEPLTFQLTRSAATLVHGVATEGVGTVFHPHEVPSLGSPRVAKRSPFRQVGARDRKMALFRVCASPLAADTEGNAACTANHHGGVGTLDDATTVAFDTTLSRRDVPGEHGLLSLHGNLVCQLLPDRER